MMHGQKNIKLTRYWLQASWGWHGIVETSRSVIICEIIVHLLVIVQNNKGRTAQRIKFRCQKVKIKKINSIIGMSLL